MEVVKLRKDDDPFDDVFWPRYPKKVAKKIARKALGRALGRASLEMIMVGVERYIEGKPEWQAWMHAATFLNGDRWEDDWRDATAMNWDAWKARHEGG